MPSQFIMRFSDRVRQKALFQRALKNAAERIATVIRNAVPQNKRPLNPGPFFRATGVHTRDTVQVIRLGDTVKITVKAPHAQALMKGSIGHPIVGHPYLVFPVITARPGRKKASKGLRAKYGEGAVVTTHVWHPGTQPAPFVQETVSREVPRILNEELRNVQRYITA